MIQIFQKIGLIFNLIDNFYPRSYIELSGFFWISKCQKVDLENRIYFYYNIM